MTRWPRACLAAVLLAAACGSGSPNAGGGTPPGELTPDGGATADGDTDTAELDARPTPGPVVDLPDAGPASLDMALDAEGDAGADDAEGEGGSADGPSTEVSDGASDGGISDGASDAGAEPRVVASNEVNGTGICDLALAIDRIYFNEPGGVWYVPAAGGTPVSLALRGAGDARVSHGLASDATFIWFADTKGDLHRAPRRGGGVDDRELGGAALPFSNGHQLYYWYEDEWSRSIIGWGGQVAAVFLSEGATLAALPRTDPAGAPTRHAYFVDLANFYYALDGGSRPGGGDELWQAPLAGEPAIRLSAGRPEVRQDIHSVIADGTHVYFGGDGGSPRRVPIGQEEGPVELLDEPPDGPQTPSSRLVQMVIDAAHVYWATNEVEDGGCIRTLIRRQAKSLGSSPSAVIFEAAGECTKDLVSDGARLYWSMGPELGRASVKDRIFTAAK